MFKRCVFVLAALCWGWVSACGATSTATPTMTPDLAAAAQGTSAAATQAGLDARATEAQATELAERKAATDQAATQVQGTADAVAQESTREAATAAARAESTAQAAGMSNLVEELHRQGHLEATSGTYYALDEFDESWAQINWYQWWYTGFAPADFVIRADAEWDSASDRANWWASGCGFVFREDGVPNHYLAYLGLDGYVYFSRNVGGRGAQLGHSYYGRVDTPSGRAQLMLVVEGSKMVFFVNGDPVHTRQDQGLSSGNLALTLLSGINTGFGTRCHMSNIELWELD